MSTVPQERETEQVIGVLTGVVHKGEDKYQAVVMPDNSQYTKNLWTKDEQLISYLSSQIGNRLAFACNASHWTRQDGQGVRSLWIDAVGPPAVGSPAMAGPPPPQFQGAPVPQAPQQPWDQAQQAQQAGPVPPPPPSPAPPPVRDLREEKIHRQTAAKVAAILLGYLPNEERTMATLLVMSERLVAYFNEGLPNAETLDQLMQRAMPASVDPSLPQDSDIPF